MKKALLTEVPLWCNRKRTELKTSRLALRTMSAATHQPGSRWSLMFVLVPVGAVVPIKATRFHRFAQVLPSETLLCHLYCVPALPPAHSMLHYSLLK